MVDFLTNQGFQVFKSCNCNGGEAKFKKDGMPGIVIFIRKRFQTYEILRSNEVINRGMAHHLPTEYNKLFA
ncbi:hypothetical protein LCGC14_0388430 [marine sediment metagenome]|uniref:Uncharacterized protein n=1 Tax=marine sediment metagenome TaxID=412755 RepID=A0A0F9VMC1_9ZZZZ